MTLVKREITNESLPVHTERIGEGGLRTKGVYKSSTPEKPLVSIITVVFNGEKYLEETIQSVIKQTYDNIEYIVIDGGSTDRTIDIINKYDDRIDYWVSEPDRGIYDAMNKGITLVSGEWINFMNSGDQFYQEDTLINVFGQRSIENGICFLTGRCRYKLDNFSYDDRYGNIHELWKGMIFRHQSLFAPVSYHKAHPFDLSYKYAADFNFIYNAVYRDGVQIQFLEEIVSQAQIEGTTCSHAVESMVEQWRIATRTSPTLKRDLYYRYRLFRLKVEQILMDMLGMARYLSLKQRLKRLIKRGGRSNHRGR